MKCTKYDSSLCHNLDITTVTFFKNSYPKYILLHMRIILYSKFYNISFTKYLLKILTHVIKYSSMI